MAGPNQQATTNYENYPKEGDRIFFAVVCENYSVPGFEKDFRIKIPEKNL